MPLMSEFSALWCVFELPQKEAQLAELERQSAQPDLWNDQERAQKLLRDAAALRSQVNDWRQIENEIRDALDLVDLSEAEEDAGAMAEEIAHEVGRLEQVMERREFELLLSGPHDRRNAILAIHAGAGGTEANDWANMLLRMYLRWCERRGFRAEVLDRTEGEETGIKSVTVRVEGEYAYGYLRSERGVHRLVRLSPFDANHRRHTTFGLVEVMPEIDDDIEVHLDPKDLRVDVFRSSGAGGQNVQKTSTAVRLLHIPTGIIVTCQNERSQVQNRETAMRVLRARLYEIELQKREEEQARLKGKHVEAGWGNQIRSYVLHPYHLVKDLRTEYETGNTTAVLDGEIDGFIEAYLKWAALGGA
jgi:peptide chain release factor 2